MRQSVLRWSQVTKNRNRVGLARQALAAMQWILLDMHKTMTGEIAEATVLHRKLMALKTSFCKEIVDCALHNPVSSTIFGDLFDDTIREKADNLQALRQVEPAMVSHQGKRNTPLNPRVGWLP